MYAVAEGELPKISPELGGRNSPSEPPRTKRLSSSDLLMYAGWKTIGFEDTKAYQSRPVASAEGLIKGYSKYGEAHYFRHVHPLIVAVKALLLAMNGKFNLSSAYFNGYMNARKNKMSRLTDPELIRYFRTGSIKTFLRSER